MKQLSISDYARELQELGCTGETAAEILNLLRQNQYEAASALLKRHKQQLLAELHNAGQKVDLLDFLLYQIKNHPHND
ncbi:MAG: hypothetical protein DBY32_06355 [Phascolarctobacterium sp.]|nr:MAG: hypothetical protein DBY32_06355 [Phascolarctobacterium sp.]